MRFLMMVTSDERVEAGVLPDEKMLSEMGAYNRELIEAGLVLAMDGLKPSSQGTRIRLSGGKSALIGRKLIGEPDGVELINLPSSSPAHTRPFPEKAAAWARLAQFCSPPQGGPR